MSEEWVVVFTTDVLHKAELIKQVLSDEEVNAVVMNKKDSAYGTIGEIDVMVQRDNIIKAKFILNTLHIE